MDPNDGATHRRRTGLADDPSRWEDRDRQITTFNRKAVVTLAAIGGMTLMVVSFVLTAPRRGPSSEGLIPAADLPEELARRNYLSSPLQLDPLLRLNAGAPGDSAAQALDGLDPFVIPVYASSRATTTTTPIAPPELEGPTDRELEFERAMRCGVRRCPNEGAGNLAPWFASDLDAIASGTLAGYPAFASPAATTSGQVPRDRHETFLRENSGMETSTIVASQLQHPASPYQIMAGTLIPATLVTAINSNLPGEVVAQITRNVYDTQQRYLLIPAGSRVLGRVHHQVGLGQARVNIAWHRIIFPNNNSLSLPGFGGVDAQGASGLRDRVNNNYTRTYLNAVLLSAISAGAQLSQPQSGYVYAPAAPGQVAAGALGNQMAEVSSEIIRRNMQVGPTLEIRAGYNFSIYLSQDLILAPYQHDEAR